MHGFYSITSLKHTALIGYITLITRQACFGLYKKDRPCNGQKKKKEEGRATIYKMYTKKTIDWAKRTLLNTQMCRKSEQSLLF
jgi:hypothetical protein